MREETQMNEPIPEDEFINAQLLQEGETELPEEEEEPESPTEEEEKPELITQAICPECGKKKATILTILSFKERIKINLLCDVCGCCFFAQFFFKESTEKESPQIKTMRTYLG